MKALGFGTLVVVGVIALIVAVFLFQAWLVMVLWNALAAYFGFKAITFAISACIVLAIGIVSSTVKTALGKN